MEVFMENDVVYIYDETKEDVNDLLLKLYKEYLERELENINV